MKPLLHPSSFCFFSAALLIIFTVNIQTCLCEDDEYTNCNTAFSCDDSIKDLKYPFWGGNRESYCGAVVDDPNTKLTCEDNVSKITINNLKYRILEWDNTTQKLTVARDDYSGGDVCAGNNNYQNSTFDNAKFQRYKDDVANVTLLYGCNVGAINLPTLLYDIECSESKYVFYTVVYSASFSAFCAPTHAVVIPILGSLAKQLESENGLLSSVLKKSLQSGFELKWSGNYGECEKCVTSGGACGNGGTQFRCFCDDGIHATTCLSSLLSSSSISSFDCANLKNLTYPFWRSSRPQYCGHPNFELQCKEEFATITIMSQNYRILEAVDSVHRLKIVRTDYWNNVCPTIPKNTTLGQTFFDYSSDPHNVTLYYDCSYTPFPLLDSLSPQFNCSINGTQMVNYFLLESNLVNDEGSVSESIGTCKSRVIVPILESEAERMVTDSSMENLKRAIDNGFEVEWNANNSLCHECQSSSGHCGYDPNSKDFTCFCKDGSFPHSCSRSGEYLMLSLSLSSPITTTIVIIFFFIFCLHHTTSLPSHASPSSCNNSTFNCGTITNLSYPFTGGDRPSFCGPPQFHLNCKNNIPELNISSLSYRVLQINSVTHSLILARLDLWNETCTQNYINSTFDGTSFSYGSGNRNLTLFYGCKPTSEFTKTPQNLFYCENNGYKNNSYSLIGPFPSDPVLKFVDCDESVGVPILVEQANRFIGNRSLLREVLMKGFNVSYSNPFDDDCFECIDSGGQHCGFDSDDNESICICGNELCPAGQSISKGPVIGGVVAGVAALVCILGFVCLVVRRRRKNYEKSRSRDLFVPPSSSGTGTGTLTSTTNSSQSIPSYPSSKLGAMPKSSYFGVQVFTYEELEEATNNFDASKELGDGGFGTVYKGDLKDGRVVAVKRHYESNFKRVTQFMNEVEILAKLRHKNLVTLYGCSSKHSRELLLVYEYIPNGTVADHIHGKQSSSYLLPWSVRFNIALETAEALAYLHASDVVHRDVKSNNILLDEKFHVKVADFGLSRWLPNDVTHVSTAPQGTPGYVDPEYYQCYQLNDKSDVYSFGVVLAELISSLQAVDITRHRSDVNLANMAVNKIQGQELHELVDPFLGYEKDSAVRRMTTAVGELAFRCLQQQRDMRPSMDEVVEVLRAIKSDELETQESKVLDVVVRTDELVLLNKGPYPASPNSVADKWVSGSSTSTSS
ncbi:LEAF RUST 10 DISEASE-RESISTANCE LOCUS RECEPTOR-LIKE PROTEIN KINASE-like 1.4 [Vicia villosa]|uniref:LEAF RUST 10 DISEASE-RESISTANCE LOCUS RECEPTOR-LIKE PROTEIN KINASE-like 1.4 n=1 Tax=Vicia villosa TaxID=3911 RepID=UPI00273BAEFE|nr:LEAF RUST 10 DISEASE-RESISTANCE LOCUS RECEPTOR-LIKE PROTEIN KINASE-like 1.4 [Vicia villosa]